MPNCDKLLEHAKNSPSGLRFAELCALAECFGFVAARQSSSHCVYKYPGRLQLMNFQSVGGRAKEYQVNQLLSAIEDLQSGGGQEDA